MSGRLSGGVFLFLGGCGFVAACRAHAAEPHVAAPQIRGLGETSVRKRLTPSPSRGMASNPVFGSETGLAQAAGTHVDLMTDATVEGEVTLGRYGVMVLRP